MNHLISQYLVHSYLYYQLDNSTVSDGEYDNLAKQILENWDNIEHPHKHLISKDALHAGTFLLSEDEYPTIVKDTAKMMKNKKIVDKT